MARLFRPLMVIAFVLGILGPTTAAFAVDLVAVVDGQPITSYDISQRVALNGISGGNQSSSVVLNELIDEVLQQEEAARRGVVVSASQIENAFASIAQQVGMSVSQFNSALLEAGVQPDTLRASLRAQIAWSGVLQTVSNAAGIRQTDVTAALIARGDDVATINEYLLLPIIFVSSQGSSDRRGDANAFRNRFTGCDTALQTASTYRDVVVQDIIRRDSSELSGDTGAEVQRLSVGRTTAPFRVDEGWEVIAVCQITAIQANEAARNEVAAELIAQQGVEIGADLMADLRERAIITRY